MLTIGGFKAQSIFSHVVSLMRPPWSKEWIPRTGGTCVRRFSAMPNLGRRPTSSAGARGSGRAGRTTRPSSSSQLGDFDPGRPRSAACSSTASPKQACRSARPRSNSPRTRVSTACPNAPRTRQRTDVAFGLRTLAAPRRDHPRAARPRTPGGASGARRGRCWRSPDDVLILPSRCARQWHSNAGLRPPPWTEAAQSASRGWRGCRPGPRRDRSCRSLG